MRNVIITIVKLILYYFAYQLGFSVVAMGISHLGVPLDMVTMTSLAMVASTLMMSWHLVFVHTLFTCLTMHCSRG